MERTEKENQISEIKARMAKATSVVLADFRGLTVAVESGMRREFRAAGCEYKVLKNTLVKRAIAGTPMEGLSKFLAGPTAVAVSFEDPAAVAKVATKVAKAEEKFKIKAGYCDGQVFDHKGVEALATMPGKDELRAKLLATFQAPLTDFVRLMQAAPQTFMHLLSARERELGQKK
jgi:large subunit ribosomal protein L10